jgi:hypothetical protein
MFNTYSFSTARMVIRTRLSVQHVRTLSAIFYMDLVVPAQEEILKRGCNPVENGPLQIIG